MPAIHSRLGAFSAALALLAASCSAAVAQKAYDTGASDAEMCRIILSIDAAKEPDRARRALASHLKRARWMTEHGYRHLLQ